MKNTVLKWYVTIICLFYNVLIFADPGDTSDTGDLQEGDYTPINGPILFLVLAGILLAVYTFRRNRKLA
jgi:hypothetical protein